MESSEAPAQGPFRPKVLVADDERVIADTLAIILRQNGFDTAVAYDGEEAVEKPHLRPGPGAPLSFVSLNHKTILQQQQHVPPYCCIRYAAVPHL